MDDAPSLEGGPVKISDRVATCGSGGRRRRCEPGDPFGVSAAVVRAISDCSLLDTEVRRSGEPTLRQWNELDRLRLLYRELGASDFASDAAAAFDLALSELEEDMDERNMSHIDKSRRMPAISVIATAPSTRGGHQLIVGLDPVVSLSWEVSFNDFEEQSRTAMQEAARLRHGVFVVPSGRASCGDPLAPIERRVASFVSHRCRSRA